MDVVCPDMIARANSTYVDIVIIGVGNDADQWMDQIDCLDVADSAKDIFYVTDFNSGGFNAIEALIRNKTCNGLNPAGPADFGGDQWVYPDGNTSLGPVPTGSGNGDPPKDDTPSPVDNVALRGNVGDVSSPTGLSGMTSQSVLLWAVMAGVLVLMVLGGVGAAIAYSFRKMSVLSTSTQRGVCAMHSNAHATVELPTTPTPTTTADVNDEGDDDDFEFDEDEGVLVAPSTSDAAAFVE